MRRPATKLLTAASLCLALLVSGCTALLAPNVDNSVDALRSGQYSLDQAHATLLFKISHFGLSDYVGRFNRFDASLDFDPENIEQAHLQAIIEMNSLDINNPDLQKELLGAKWFDQASYPQASLTTNSVRKITATQFLLLANLQWRGVSKPISLDIIFNGGARNLLTGKYTVGFSATGSFLRSDYGVKAYLPIVGDRVRVEIYAEFQKQ